MKKSMFAVLIAVALLTMGVTAVLAASVAPILVAPWSPSGGSAGECEIASYYTGVDYMFTCKIDGWGLVNMNGTYYCPIEKEDYGDNEITISNSNGTYFDWSALNAIGAVIVKGGTVANIYAYDPQAYSDTGLNAPLNKKKPFEVSHVTFCWNPETEICWDGETAWADGLQYSSEKGSWAMYVPYYGEELDVDLIAGRNMVAGNVNFSAPVDNMVTITITLNPGWRLKVLEGNVEMLKVQGYSLAPSGNPAPGGFTYKTDLLTIDVQVNNFYGVHVDVEQQVECLVVE